MSRIEEIESLLDCTILNKLELGQSLEKYHAIFDDQEVMIRIYSDNYYGNRFLREGLVLRKSESISTGNIKIPSIIDEWPEYQIRVIEWIEFSQKPVTPQDINETLKWLKTQNLDLPYTLQNDIIPHLLDTSDLHIAYIEFYSEYLDKVLDEIDWTQGEQVLNHGDFHLGNIKKSNEQIVIFDWEYATIGSEFYDKAYLKTINPKMIKESIPHEWLLLTNLINAHWYLQESNFSPKLAIEWVDRIGKLKF